MDKKVGENLASLIAAGKVSRADGRIIVAVSDGLGFSTPDTPRADDRIWGFSGEDGEDNWCRMEEEAQRFDIPTDEYWYIAEPALNACVEADAEHAKPAS